MSVWFLSQSLMQKDPGQAGESVVTLQRSGAAEPVRGGVSSGGTKKGRGRSAREKCQGGRKGCCTCGAEEEEEEEEEVRN